MLFNSNIFLFAFLPLAILGYYLLAHSRGAFAAKIWLCAASFVFYGWWNPAFLVLLTGSIAVNYSLSLFLDGEDDDHAKQSLILGAGVVANLLLLFYYKYLFPLLGFLHVVGLTTTDFGSTILPLGISFFTFTQIGYLFDCRQGLVQERGFVNYVLFVTFFPHLIAGPILHHREIMPQFADEATYRFKSEHLAAGLTLFAFGLFKKVVFADSIAPWAEQGFAHPDGTPMLEAWSIVLAYSMQLYFDFSAYSDMAIALGIMFGVKLPLNFNSPYKSRGIIDFWQRWHMTLTRYLTLLLYNPLSMWVAQRRQRLGKPSGRKAAATPAGFASMVVFPTLTTMLLAGIWHGAGLQFAIFGALHGIYLSINHAWRMFGPRPADPATQSRLGRRWTAFWPVALTYLGILVTQVFFRAENTRDALTVLAGMVGLHGTGLPLPIPLNNVHFLGPAQQWILDHGIFVVAPREAYNALTLPMANYLMLGLGLAVIAFGAPNVYQIMGRWSPALTQVPSKLKSLLLWRPNLSWALACSGLMFWASTRMDHAARFLYFQF